MVQVDYLSIGQVSAVIAAAIFAGMFPRGSGILSSQSPQTDSSHTVQALLPLAIPLILLGTFDKDTGRIRSTAVTW